MGQISYAADFGGKHEAAVKVMYQEVQLRTLGTASTCSLVSGCDREVLILFIHSVAEQF